MSEKKNKPGRKRKDIEHATANQILEGSAIPAAELVRDLIRGVRKRISQQRYSAAIFDLEQCLGKARQKIEHSGGILTYKSLLESAEDMEKTKPELLVDPKKVSKN